LDVEFLVLENDTTIEYHMKLLTTMLFSLIALLIFPACGEEDPHVASDDNWVVVKERGYVGFINKYGNREVRTEFAAGRRFSENRAGINVGAGNYRRGLPLDGKWGFINQQGTIVINPIYEPGKNAVLPYKKSDYHLVLHDVYRYAEGLAAVKMDGKWKYINKEGDIVIHGASRIEGMQKISEPLYAARAFRNGVAAVKLKDGWGFINKKGEILVPGSYSYAYDANEGFLVTANRKGEHFCFNMKGQPVFTQRRIAGPFHDGMVAVFHDFRPENSEIKEDQLELMDLQGRFTSRAEFDFIGQCGSGRCPARVGSSPIGKIGGAEHITARRFEGGMWGFIDTTGQFVINPTMSEAKGFNEGYAPIRMGKKWGFLGTDGQYLIPPRFSFAGPFRDGFARVFIGRNEEIHPGRAAWVNRQGEIIWTDGTANR
jgi:hypothetical protein